MSAPIRNYDIAELRRLDLAHHLPAQADHKVIAELGGSRLFAAGLAGCRWHHYEVGASITLFNSHCWCQQPGIVKIRIDVGADNQN